MAGFSRPTLGALRALYREKFREKLGAVILRFSVLGVIADVLADVVIEQYAYLDWMVDRALFLDTAGGAYLERQGAPFGILRQAPASAAGAVAFAGIDDRIIPAGSIVTTPDGLAAYVTRADVTIAAGVASAEVDAQTAGTIGNLPPGAALRLFQAIAGVLADAAAPAGLTGGADAESDAALRARIYDRKRNPPQGGAWFDYVAWAKNVPGVTRAWVYPLRSGAGTVAVCFVMDGRADIVPLSGDVDAVQAAIDLARPVTDQVAVFAPTATPIAVTLDNLVAAPGYSTGAALANAAAALGVLFAAMAPGAALYGAGVAPTRPGGVVLLEKIYAAIDAAEGVASFDLVAPSVDTTAALGDLPTLGAVTSV